MPTSKEAIRQKYQLSDEEWDTVTALALRPTCEHCDRALPPESTEARICSFECTFCADCVEHVLGNVCPNCGGGFERRPIRPARNWRRGNFLGAMPASTTPVCKPVDRADQLIFAAEIAKLEPARR